LAELRAIYVAVVGGCHLLSGTKRLLLFNTSLLLIDQLASSVPSKRTFVGCHVGPELAQVVHSSTAAGAFERQSNRNI
jgi:hypothetical protein